MRAEFSQCVAINVGATVKIFSKVFSSSTSMSPVEAPMKIFIRRFVRRGGGDVRQVIRRRTQIKTVVN